MGVRDFLDVRGIDGIRCGESTGGFMGVEVDGGVVGVGGVGDIVNVGGVVTPFEFFVLWICYGLVALLASGLWALKTLFGDDDDADEVWREMLPKLQPYSPAEQMTILVAIILFWPLVLGTLAYMMWKDRR